MSRIQMCLVALAASACPVTAQSTVVTFPEELAVVHGNATLPLGFHLSDDHRDEIYTRDTPSGWYFAAGFRACAGAARAVPTPIVLDIVLRIVPRVTADPLADDLNTVYDPNGGTVVFAGAVTIGPVAPPQDPLVDLALAANAPAYRVPFQVPTHLAGGTMWVWEIVSRGPAAYVDSHVQQALFPNTQAQLVPGLRATDATRSCAQTFAIPEPLLLYNDYANDRYRLIGETANAGFGIAQALLVGRLLTTPVHLGCDLWVDPLLSVAFPLSPDGPSVQSFDVSFARPPALGFTPLLAVQQVQVWSDGLIRSTPASATIASPWMPGGYGVDARFLVRRMSPGWQWFPVLLAWKS